MNLRSDSLIKSRGNPRRDLVSRGSIEESVNQVDIEHLSTIQEEVACDTSSEPAYIIRMERVPGINFHSEGKAIGTSRSHETRPKMLLQHYLTNNKREP